MTVAVQTHKRPFDPATRKPRAKKVYDLAEAKGRDASRFEWYDAFREANLPLAAKALGFVLSTYGNRLGDRNFPGLTLLAANLHLDEKTVRNNLILLETAGWLRKTSDYANGPNRIYADVYQLTIPDTFVPSKPPKVATAPPEWAVEPEPTKVEPEEVEWIPEVASLDSGIQPTSHLSSNKDTSSAALRAAPGRGRPRIVADAPTDEGSTESAETPRTDRMPKRRKASTVSEETRAERDGYISLIPRLSVDEVQAVLDKLAGPRWGVWKWAHNEMRKTHGEPPGRTVDGEDIDYYEPETPAKARMMYVQAFMCTSRSGVWHECLTDPLDAAEGA
jgi:hypothetical protein